MRDFNHTVNVLVKAYLNDTLRHNNCYACAVGNMIASANGFKYSMLKEALSDNKEHWLLKWAHLPSIYDAEIELSSNDQQENWMNVFRDGEVQYSNYNGKSKELIDSTGYTVYELARIEEAFEDVDSNCTNDEWMFNGLMAVIEVLAEIHGIDLKQKEEAKALFVKH
jgi:hypothetical protein